jgi:hypothetical protein
MFFSARGSARLEDLGGALNRTLWPLVWLVVATTIGGCVSAGILIANGAGKAAALVAVLGPALGGLAGALAAFVGTRQEAALEAIIDHQILAGRSWWRVTRTRMPRTRRGAARWLDRNAETPSNLLARARLLLWVGKLGLARSALERFEPELPEDRFDLQVLRGELAYLEGRPIDLAPPRTALRSILERDVWRQRRVSLALLEARAAFQAGTDPWSPLAIARAELPVLDPRARGSRIVGFGVVVVGVGIALAVASVLLI